MKKRVVPVYIVKTADIYSLIVYISSNIQDVANFLKSDIKDIANKMNTAGIINKYRVQKLNLLYKKNEKEY